MTAHTTNEDGELEQILKDVWKNGKWFAKHQFDKQPITYADGRPWNVALEDLTHYIARKTVARAIEELQRLHDWAFEAFEPASRAATVLLEIDDRIAELTKELNKLDGEK